MGFRKQQLSNLSSVPISSGQTLYKWLKAFWLPPIWPWPKSNLSTVAQNLSCTSLGSSCEKINWQTIKRMKHWSAFIKIHEHGEMSPSSVPILEKAQAKVLVPKQANGSNYTFPEAKALKSLWIWPYSSLQQGEVSHWCSSRNSYKWLIILNEILTCLQTYRWISNPMWPLSLLLHTFFSDTASKEFSSFN